MGRLFGMITRVAVWGAGGAALGYVGVMAYELAFKGGSLGFTSGGATKGAGIGLVAGAVIGFFRRN